MASKKILVIDDDSHIRETLTDFLENEGFDLILASDGEEGLEMLEKHGDIQLMITDIMMPKKEGISTIMEVKRTFPHIKIIAMSGADKNTNYLKTAQDFGAKYVISKPFDLDVLKKLIEKVFNE
jgi:two-component system chemotaxis response regulator CheY